MSDLGHIEIKMNLGGNEHTLGIKHFHVVDVVRGGELEAARLGKSVRVAFDDAVSQVNENVALWGFEGLILEAKGRVSQKESK